MGQITESAKAAYASGPSGDAYEPNKADIIRLFQIIEGLLSTAVNGLVVGGAIVYATRSALFGDLARPANTLGVVYNDSTAAFNGVYVKVGASGTGSWTMTTLVLPATIASDLASAVAEIIAARNGASSLAARLAALVDLIALKVNASFVADAVAQERSERQAELGQERAKRQALIDSSPLIPGVIAAIADAAGNMTWMQANDTDGGLTDAGAALLIADLRERRAVPNELSIGGTSFAVADASGNLTWLQANSFDGGPTASSIRLLSRYLPALAQPVLSDKKTIAGWGSSQIEWAGTEFQAMATSLGATWFNGGDAGVRADVIAAKNGAIPALIQFPNGVIPASGEVTVTASNMAASSEVTPWSVWIEGTIVDGTISCADTINWKFMRRHAGAPVDCALPVRAIPIEGYRHRAAVQIINIGKGDISQGRPNALSECIRCSIAVSESAAILDRCILSLGHFCNQGTPAVSWARDQVLAYNAAMLAYYGDAYCDLQGYVTGSQVWVDTGITPTSADLAEQALGNIPPSIGGDGAHLNGPGKTAMCNHLIKPKLISLGWYTE